MSIDIIMCHPKKKNGFTLLEVLIAMVIMAFGLLGLAGLQASGLKQNQSAFLRSQATQLAYDLADRMRSNSVEASKLAASKYMTVLPGNATSQASCNSSGCTPIQMAENDLYEWNASVTNTLPNASVTLTQAAGIYTITLTWDDSRDGTSMLSFQMSFRI